MNRQQVADELGQPGAQELLDGSAAHLAYDGPDGLPRVIPIGVYWNGERIIVCTATTSPKVAALSSRPNVALSIDSGDSPGGAKSLLIRGIASLETVDGVADEYIAMSAKSMDATQKADFEREVRKVYTQMVRISIEPQWARFFDYGAGRLPAFLDNLSTADPPHPGDEASDARRGSRGRYRRASSTDRALRRHAPGPRSSATSSTKPTIATTFGVTSAIPNPNTNIAVKIGLRTTPKTPLRTRVVVSARVDADPPGVTHVDLRVDRRGDADDRHHDPGELDPRRMQETQRRHQTGQLQNRREKRGGHRGHEADAGEPLHRTDAAGDPAETGRPGAAVLKPTAPTESEQTEDGEQRECDNGHDRSSHQQHGSPRQAFRPSRTATAAMTNAATGSAHDQPEQCVEHQSDQQRRRQIGAQQRLLRIRNRRNRSQFTAGAPLRQRQHRHDDEACRGEHDADQRRSAVRRSPAATAPRRRKHTRRARRTRTR